MRLVIFWLVLARCFFPSTPLTLTTFRKKVYSTQDFTISGEKITSWKQILKSIVYVKGVDRQKVGLQNEVKVYIGIEDFEEKKIGICISILEMNRW